VVTDRDICMGLALSGRRPAERQVQEVMSKEVFACTPDDDVGDALEIMGSRRIRRLPVVDGDRLVGVLSMNDILTRSGVRGQPPAREILAALRGICRPRSRPGPTPVPRAGAA
jgi:signal-transduction protein with cAMP-binding, CBS, and nucleotidyltransferase domain